MFFARLGGLGSAMCAQFQCIRRAAGLAPTRHPPPTRGALHILSSVPSCYCIDGQCICIDGAAAGCTQVTCTVVAFEQHTGKFLHVHTCASDTRFNIKV